MVDPAENFNPAESLKKLIVMGVGAGLMAKDEMEKFAREFSKKFEMGEKDAQKFFDDLEKRYDKAQKKLEARVEDTVREFLKKADIVTSDELKALKKEIRDLKKAVSEGTSTKEE
jgi:polyhydroxyalkanoate synthesis regulator phasin